MKCDEKTWFSKVCFHKCCNNLCGYAEVDALVAKGVISESQRFDSCTINLYAAGQWIPPHIDNPAFVRPFVTVSLCSRQTMVLGRGMVWPEGTDPNDEGNEDPNGNDDINHEGVCSSPAASTSRRRSGEEATLELPVGSAVVMSDDAADVYEHAIPPVSEERISLTFRRVMPPGEPLRLQTERTEACRKEYRDKRRAVADAAAAAAPVAEVVPEVRRGSGVRKPVARAAAATAAGAGAGDGIISKNQAKRGTKKAARSAAKERYKKEEKARVTSVDGSEIEKKEKKRSCPPCPVHLLPAQDDEANEANESKEFAKEVAAAGAGAATGAGAAAGGDKDDKNENDENDEALLAEAEALPFVEREHVQAVYDAVAQQWHGTRYRAWSGVEDFIERTTFPGSLVADVGCGNGGAVQVYNPVYP
jgi:hypothetical protein